ncbi:MAG: hypothetical protein ACXAES_02860 [Promethearchaeota archaeon]|jgi:hypothetical protein
MSNTESKEGNEEENLKEKKRKRRPTRKTQGQIIQESLGLNPKDIQEIEKKLFIARFLDFFSEDTLEFIFKERSINQNLERTMTYMKALEVEREEEKLLTQSFESKNVVGVIKNIKNRTEEIALSQGVKGTVHKQVRKWTLITTLPVFAFLIVFTFLGDIFGSLTFVFFPIICIACVLPQFIRGRLFKKWSQFKEENKDNIYAENRDDIMVLKSFTGELLDNIRTRLIELEVPLQLITFPLFSRDYENLNLINQRSIQGLMQYFYTFAYPEGMEPIPIPENLQRYQQPIAPGRKEVKLEKNFVVLTEMMGKDGVITYFVPTLKDMLADKINNLLNECRFTKAPEDFLDIVPGYSKDLAIYCLCGEVAEIDNIQICNWKEKFKFYLFEAKQCDCGDNIFVLSLMDESTDIPEELKDIFLS